MTGQVAVDAMLAATRPDGERMLADAFQGFAVSFARYCEELDPMAQTAQLPRPADRRTAIAVGAMLVAVALVVSVGDLGRFAWVRTFFVIFGSLLIQALPFVLLGALPRRSSRCSCRSARSRSSAPPPLQLPAAAMAGLAFPICECGSVPVARRLMQRGLMPSAAVTFMLAAPVLNPVVIASTFVAFRGRTTLLDDGRRPLPPRHARRDRRAG